MADSSSDNFGLMKPEIGVGGHGPKIHTLIDQIDSEILKLLILSQMAVLDKDLTTPPGTPTDRDTYIVASGATGDWAGQDKNIAIWSTGTGTWTFITPETGWRAWAVDEIQRYRYWGGNWIKENLLDAIALLGPVANQLIYTTGTNGVALTALTAFARTLLDDADAATMQATLGLVIGQDVAAYVKHNLTASTNPTVNDDNTAGYQAGSVWINQSASPKEAYRCVDASTGAADWVNSTLEIGELGTMANQAANAVAITGGTLSGITSLLMSGILNMQDNILQRPEIKDYSETVVTVADAGASYQIDLSAGNVFKITMTQNCSFTFTNWPASGKCGNVTVYLYGAYTPSFPAAVDWGFVGAPTWTATAGKYDRMVFSTLDAGTIIEGAIAGLGYTA